jgi:hypothetical protein
MRRQVATLNSNRSKANPQAYVSNAVRADAREVWPHPAAKIWRRVGPVVSVQTPSLPLALTITAQNLRQNRDGNPKPYST